MREPLKILHEDNHLLAVIKPAGLATMGVAADETSLFTLAKDYLKRRYNKPGNVYLGVVSRLDEPVSGVALLARTSKAAARLSEQFRSRSVEKIYWAIVEGTIEPPAGEWIDFIAKHEPERRMRCVAEGSPEAREARLRYRRLQPLSADSLVEFELETGRKHQIRLQCALCGFPILGDRKYDSPRTFPKGIALHARRLSFDHPISKARIELVAPLPASCAARSR